MRVLLVFTALLLNFTLVAEEVPVTNYQFEPSVEFPFGRANPEAPKQIKDFELMVGESQCLSEARNADQSWQKPEKIIWRFKYIMNGHGVQDETLKPDGSHSGSIRQFILDNNEWYVHYYSSNAPTTTLPTWEGNKTEKGDIVLYREQTAPNGMDGFYKITFYDISAEQFNWLGEWINKEETFSYPTWKISCKKVSSS